MPKSDNMLVPYVLVYFHFVHEVFLKSIVQSRLVDDLARIKNLRAQVLNPVHGAHRPLAQEFKPLVPNFHFAPVDVDSLFINESRQFFFGLG